MAPPDGRPDESIPGVVCDYSQAEVQPFPVATMTVNSVISDSELPRAAQDKKFCSDEKIDHNEI